MSGTIPNPIVVPPPTTTLFYPNPIIMNVGPISSDFPALPRLFSYEDRCVFRDNAFAWREQKCMLFPSRRVAIANDETRIVNRLGNSEDLDVTAGKIADAIKIDHLAIVKEEGVDRAIIGRGKSNDLTGRVGPKRATLRAAKRPEIAHRAVGITKRVIRICSLGVGCASDTFGVVRVARAPDAAERAEIVHRAIRVKERVIQTVGRLGKADDLAGRINRAGRAGRSAKRS